MIYMFILSRQHRIRICLILYAMLIGTSCTHDYMSGGDVGPGDGKVPVTFMMEIPAATLVPVRTTYGDRDVINVDVMVFDQNQKFLERIGTDQVSDVGNYKSFTVRLDPSTTIRQFMVLINVRTAEGDDRVDMSGFTPGVSWRSGLEMLETLPLAGGRADEIQPLIMYGVGAIYQVDDIASYLYVDVKRVAACVQVKIGQPYGDNGLEDFSLLRATLGNAAASAKLTNFLADEGELNVPDNLSYVDYWSSAWLNAGWSVGPEPLLYAYERYNTTDDYMSVLVHASWKGQEYYYRIRMQDDAGVPYNIIRNRRYIITVVRVEGPGWSTPELAMANPPTNDIEVQITDDEDDTFIVITDNHYKLGLSNNSFEGWGSSYGDQEWRMVDVWGTNPNWETLLIHKVATADMEAQKLIYVNTNSAIIKVWNTNPSAVDRSGSVTVQCGNLALPIAVRFVESKFQSGYVDKDEDSFVFLVADETTPKPWRVWIPNFIDSPQRIPRGVRLSTSSSAADFTPVSGSPTTWGSTLLESRTVNKAYLHVPASAVYDCAGDCISLSDGSGDVRRIEIMNY